MTVCRWFVVRVAVVCIALPAAAASGQRLPSTFDANAQVWGAMGDPRRYSHSGGFAVEAVVARYVRPFSHGALVVGGAAALHGVIGNGDVCRMAAPPVPDAPLACLPDAPSFASLSALGGVEGTLGLTGRLLGGPAVILAGARGTALGVQGRVDVATPAPFHLALVLSARGTVVPNFEGGSATFVALGVGFGIR